MKGVMILFVNQEHGPGMRWSTTTRAQFQGHQCHRLDARNLSVRMFNGHCAVRYVAHSLAKQAAINIDPRTELRSRILLQQSPTYHVIHTL